MSTVFVCAIVPGYPTICHADKSPKEQYPGATVLLGHKEQYPGATVQSGHNEQYPGATVQSSARSC